MYVMVSIGLLLFFLAGRNLQKDKHHCNTPSIWVLCRCGQTQSFLQLRRMKTHLEKSPKGPSDYEKQDSLVWWSSILSIMIEWNQLCSSPAEYHTIPKVTCAGSSLMLWGCFSVSGTAGLVRLEEKLNAPNYWDSLNENSVQRIQNLRLGWRFTFQQDNGPKHTARVAYRHLCECLWVAQPPPELEPNQIFLEKPENVRLPYPTWQSLRREEVRRRMSDNC